MRFDTLKTYANQQYVLNIGINFSKIVDDEQLVSFVVQTNVTAFNIIGSFEFAIKTKPNITIYDMQVLKSNVNCCRMSDGVASNFLTKMLLDSFSRGKNKIFKCPFVPQIYEITDFPMNDRYIPKFLLMNVVQFKADLNIRAKFGNNKQFVHFFNLQGFGSIVKN